MRFFDLFKKKKQIESNIKTIPQNESIIDDNSKDETFSERPHNNYDGVRIDGDVLIRVYEDNIRDGVFIVPEYITKIDMFAFSNIKKLKSIILHNGIKFIAPSAFQHCENLIEVKGISKANAIKTLFGFDYCTSLKQIDIPQSIQIIGKEAFLGCKNLSGIKLPNDVWCISNCAFAGCESLKSIEIPQSVEFIRSNAFAGCENLVITFLENNNKYLSDYIKEQKENLNPSEIEDDMDSEDLQCKEPLNAEERETLYEDLGIAYRKFNILGQQMSLPSAKVIIEQGAFLGVKEVIAYDRDTILTVMKSGYKGKLTYVDKEQEQLISIDLSREVKGYRRLKKDDKEDTLSR